MEPESSSSNAASLASRAVINTPSVVSPETSVEDVIAQMNACEDSYVLIIQNQRPTGIFTERDLVRLIASDHDISNKSIVQVMTQPVITIGRADITDAFSVFERMQQLRLRHLPIVETDGMLFGIITKNSLRKALTPSTLLKLKRVESVMQTRIVCASTTAKVRQIAQKMSEGEVIRVVILAPDNRPIGLVTERDIVQFQTLGLDMANTPAQTVMSTPLLPVHPKDSLWQTHRQMNQRRVRRFVVCTHEGELAGLITQSSLLQALNPVEVKQMIDLLQHEVEQLRTENQTLLEARNRELEKEQISLNEQLQNEQLLRREEVLD
ncbi:MAG: CBS domain-containing protein [Cyanobacteria bacterium J06649_4]